MRRFLAVAVATVIAAGLWTAAALASGTRVYTPGATWTTTKPDWGGRAPLYQNKGEGLDCDAFGDCISGGSCIGESGAIGGGWYQGYACSYNNSAPVAHYYNGTAWLYPMVGSQGGNGGGLSTYYIWGWEYWA